MRHESLRVDDSRAGRGALLVPRASCLVPSHNAPRMTYPLEPSAGEMRALVDAAMRRIVAHIESLPSQPASNVEGAAEYARTLVEPLPRRGAPLEALLDHLFDDLVPRSFNAAGPGYLAYIPGGGIFHAAVADLI